LPHFTASLEKLFLLANNVERKNKLAKTKTEENAKQALSKSQQSGYYIAYLSLKSERCQQWSMLSVLLVNIKCFE